MAEGSWRISVIVPAYNERRRLPQSLQAIRAYAERSGRTIEVVVVDDGSTDGTADLAAEHAADPLAVRVLRNDGNRGKGYSVRRGMIEAGGDVLLLSDADLSTPIEELDKLLPWMDAGYEVVIGSRAMAESVLDPPQPFFRRLLGRTFGKVRRAIILPDIWDTQCGFKLFRRDAAHAVFPEQQADGFAFDCEVLGLARKMGYRIREVGVTWRDDRDSKVRPVRDSLAILLSLLRIRRRLGGPCPAPSPAHQKAAAR